MPRRRRIIQSMFHRRLVVLVGLTALAYTAIGAQLYRLTIVRGDELRAQAESRMVRRSWLPTVRGRILDRKGRVLAYDSAAYDVRVDYAVLTGAWAHAQARRTARQLAGDAWSALPDDQRDDLTARCLAACERRVDDALDRLASAGAIERARLDDAAGSIVDRVSRMKDAVAARTRERLTEDHLASGLELDDAARARIERAASRPIVEETHAHTVLSGVPDSAGFELLRLAQRRSPLVIDVPAFLPAPADPEPVEALPGVVVRNAADRLYPLDEVTAEVDVSTFPRPIARDGVVEVTVRALAEPILGRVREGVFKEDVDRRAQALETDDALRARSLTPRGDDRGAYLPGDSVGHTGVERAREHHLRGLRGERTLDLRTEQESTLDADPGLDVHLTIDAALQARIRAVMDPALGLARVQEWHRNESIPVGTHLYGGAVVLDVETAEILALVSTPETLRDPAHTRLGFDTPEQIELFNRIFHPEINRAIAKPYPPGSIAKAMILAGAVERGEYDLSERIPATGHFLPERQDVFRSWIYKQTGWMTHRDQLGRDPDAVDALMVSANVFFYTLGRRIGATELAHLYHDYGVGETFDLGIGAEWPGRVGSLSGPGDGTDLGVPDAILMGIGQGPVTWTPLHAASAYATLARAGVVIAPRLITDGTAPRVERDLAIAPDTLDTILAGLHAAVTDESYGTGCSIDYEDGSTRERIFRAPGVDVWGKTGTATAPDIAFDPDEGGPVGTTTFLSGDHSWFVVLVGDEGGPPRYAVAVVMDYAGSGGRVSGPITDQIIRALVAEGYLTGAGTSEGGSS